MIQNLVGEEWKDIEGYEGLYQVSNMGRVKSIKIYVSRKRKDTHRIKEIILRTWLNRGYVYLKLSKNSILKSLKVHRLVAEAFIQNPMNFPDVNHKDENKENNNVSNLEWCTKLYNQKYGTAMQRSKETIRLNGRSVLAYNQNGVLVKRYQCTKDLEYDGFDRRAVNRVCKGKNKIHKGFIFKYGK